MTVPNAQLQTPPKPEPSVRYYTTNSHPSRTQAPHFLAFFFFDPAGVAGGVAEGVFWSTNTGSSALATDGAWDTTLSPPSSSLMNSFCICDRRFSHHCFSDSVWAWMSSRRFRSTVLAAISLADWKMVWPQLGARALACVHCQSRSSHLYFWEQRYSTYLHHYISQLLLHLLLRPAEPLPEVVADAASLQERAARGLCRADLDDAVDVLDRAPQEGRSYDALGDLGALLRAALRLEVQQG